MLIEEVNKKSIRKAKNRELFSLRLRALQVWDKSFIRKKEAGPISRKEFLEKYDVLVDEMKTRNIYKNTYALDQTLFFQKMHGVDVPSLSVLLVVDNFVSLRSDMKKGGITKSPNCRVYIKEIDSDKIKETIKKHLDKYFDNSFDFTDSTLESVKITKGKEKMVPVFDMVLVPKGKTEISKPEVTENYVRIPIKNYSLKGKTIRTITVKPNEIKGLYCVETKEIVTLLFDKDKYTMTTARKWIKDHEVNKMEEALRLMCENEVPIEKATSRHVPIIKVDAKKQIVAAIVYSPDEVDAQGDMATAEEIEEACNKFNTSHPRFRLNHGDKDIDVDMLQSYTLPLTGKIGDQTVKKGSWIILSRINDKEVWKKIDSGELTGISMRGFADRKEILVE